MGEKNLQYELPKSFLIHILSFLIQYYMMKIKHGRVRSPARHGKKRNHSVVF